MKFENTQFKGKYQFKRDTIHEIMNQIEDIYPGDDLSPTRLNRYIEILIDDQEFNPRTLGFHDRLTGKKLSIGFIAGIGYMYILDHLEEFKYKGNNRE